MARERAKTYADRLPSLVPRQETDIAHLSDDMADILYPGRRTRPFRVGFAFDAFDGPQYARALELARAAGEYRERTAEDGSGALVHEASFGIEGARASRDLFELVGERPGTEVLLDRKRVPYAREIWLPFFWMFVGA
ncbi:MAG: hypothetical protein ABW221_11345 [Vicinamibacteria bacterium]